MLLAWLSLPESGHLQPAGGWGAGEKGQVTEGFLLLYLYCSLQICSRLPCTSISRTWKGVSRYMLKQVTATRRKKKPFSLAVWLYLWYPVQESSFAINQTPAESACPFPFRPCLGIPRTSAQGGQAILSAAVPSQLQWRCVSRLPYANSATRKCKSVFLQGCDADQGGEEGALNKLYFLGIIVRKKLSFEGS